jgi:hypothetical protein
LNIKQSIIENKQKLPIFVTIITGGDVDEADYFETLTDKRFHEDSKRVGLRKS